MMCPAGGEEPLIPNMALLIGDLEAYVLPNWLYVVLYVVDRGARSEKALGCAKRHA